MIRKAELIWMSLLLPSLSVAACTSTDARDEDDVVDATPTSPDRADVDENDDSVPAVGAADERAPDPDADNSKRNRDEGAAPTADDQSNAESDVETTRKIRRALTEDDDLSVYAQNVKIIADDGKVVLKGPVRSADEKRLVEAKAREIAGATAVTSELVVQPK